MVLTDQQLTGLTIALQRYKAGEKYTVISGYAGSGKSTLVKFLVAALLNAGSGLTIEDVAYASFTGKAASVLQKKGNKNAMTLHKLLYYTHPLPNGKFVHSPKTELEYRIIVVDECSMVPQDMVALLFSHNAYLIFCGDPGQLPPIDKTNANHLLDKPHIFLSDIMRQSLESDIIQLSLKIRNGERIDNFKGKDAMVLPSSELNTGMLTWADIILCSTNKTRIALNSQVRELLGYEKPLEKNEKLICLKNYWSEISESGNALINGTIGYCTDFYEQTFYPPRTLGIPPIPIISCNFLSENLDKFNELNMDKNYIIMGEGSLTPQQIYKLSRNKMTKHMVPYEFTYGYSITGHRAQGSEWDKVLVIEERFPFDKEEHKKWLYTCCTRGSEKVVIIKE